MINTRNRILMNSILYICRNFYEPLLNKANVVGIGLGYRQVKGFYTSQFCIHVLVNKKINSSYLPFEDRIPNVYMGYKTDVIETGEITESESQNLSGLLVDRVRPLIGGYCIMAEGVSTGTMACVVKKRTRTGYDYFILSNNHILAGRNKLPIGAAVIQPSMEYGGDPIKDIVAELTKYIPIKDINPIYSPTNYVDCAIAKILNVNNISNKLALEGPIKGVSSIQLGEPVIKVGMKTGLTNGTVTTVGLTIKIKSNDGKHTALYKDVTRADIVTGTGDSGALVINRTNYAVGLHFAGNHKTFSIFCSIAKCLKELNVELYTG